MERASSSKGVAGKVNGLGRSVFLFGMGHDRDFFIENLSMLVASGMGILVALDAVGTDVRSKRMKKVIRQVRDSIESGSALWRALAKTRLFPSHVIALIKIGEESGRLADNLRVVSLEQEKSRIFRSRIRSAIMYPLFVLTLTVVIGVGIAWFILPKLAVVFLQLKLELPLVTRVLISIGVFLGEHGALVMPFVITAMLGVVYLIFFSPRTKIIGQTLLFWFPGVRQLIVELELARFGYLLGTLLQAGLPVNQALYSLTQSSFFPHYRRFYQHLEQRIEEGNSFQKSFGAYRGLNRIMPTPIQQLVAAGEQSGSLPRTLLRISEAYEAKTETTTKNLTVILEPILLVIVWLGVVAVAVAVILPIYSLIGNFKAQ